MARMGVYDGALQMFMEEPREPDENWLKYLKFLADRGDFDDDRRPLPLD